MRIKRIAFAASLIFCLMPVQFARPAAATATHPANTNRTTARSSPVTS
jgi:hypothetical protein